MNRSKSMSTDPSSGIVYYWNLNTGPIPELPLRQGPIRFAVGRRNGLSSNSWRVWTEKSRDTYVLCRDNMDEIKASLRQSGEHRLAYTSESGLVSTQGNRYWSRWTEPQIKSGSKVMPSLAIMFPSWGLGLTPAIRDENPKIWNSNQVVIEAAEKPEATIVSFVVLDDDLDMRFSTSGIRPSLPLGMLPMGCGRSVWVIVDYVLESNMMEMAATGLKALADDAANTVERLKDLTKRPRTRHVRVRNHNRRWTVSDAISGSDSTGSNS